ncbi:hypothetical protein Tco_1483811 [Tanacetum coccineum]
MVLAPGQPIPHGRPYRYHLNGPVHFMTMRKRVRPIPTHRLAMRHSVDYSSSDHFSSDDSSSSSSSETSSDSSADALSDSASSRSSSDHSLPPSPSGMRSSHHLCSLRSRSPIASIPLSLPTLGALSYARVDLLSSPKWIRSPEIATDLKGCLEDSLEPAQEGAVEVTYETLGALQSADMLERIGELERDNRRLRDIVDVESQRVT